VRITALDRDHGRLLHLVADDYSDLLASYGH
jgi:hypothetical protein